MQWHYEAKAKIRYVLFIFHDRNKSKRRHGMSVWDLFANYSQKGLAITNNIFNTFAGEIAKFQRKLNRRGYYNLVVNNNMEATTSFKKPQAIILDFRCALSKTFLQKSNENVFLPKRLLPTWVIFNSDVESVKNVSIGVNSNVFIVTFESNTGGYKIVSPYKINITSTDLCVNNIALWKQDRFLYYNKLSEIRNRNRSDLLGMPMNFTVALSNLSSINHLTNNRERHLDTLAKYNCILVNILADVINISRNFLVNRADEYKTVNAAMMSDLQSGVAEIGVTPILMSANHLVFVDFFAPTRKVHAKFIFRAPPLSYMSNIFTLPFQSFVWYCCFLLMFIITIVLYVIASHECNKSTFHMQATIPNVLQIAIGAISQQGTEIDPKSGSGRIAVFTTFLALLFLFTAYSANIVGLLQSTSDNIRTNEDLVASNIILAAEDIPYARHLFSLGHGTTLYVSENNFLDAETGIKRVQNEFFAFHIHSANMYKIVSDTFKEEEKCGLMEINYPIVKDPWLTIRKNSLFTEIFKIIVLKMLESGIQNREFQRKFTPKLVCSKAAIFTNVGIIDCHIVIVAFLSGLGLSIFVLGLEILTCKKFGRTCQRCSTKTDEYLGR